MELTTRELARFIELKRKKAELETERAKGANVEHELGAIATNLSALEARAKSLDVLVLTPFQKRIAELTEGLKAIPREDLEAATKVRDGALYELLKQRTILTRKNLENRLEIAKLSILASKLPASERAHLVMVVADGRIVAPLPASTLAETERALLARVLRRCGIPCSFSNGQVVPAESLEAQELCMELSGKRIWISAERAVLMRENLKKVPAIATKIQLKNAERQIRVFPPEEEKEFESLQHSYLALLKEQDEIVKEYSDEELLSAKKTEPAQGVAVGPAASPVKDSVVTPSSVAPAVLAPAVSTPNVVAEKSIVAATIPSSVSSAESDILDPALIAKEPEAAKPEETKSVAKPLSPDDEPITFDDEDDPEEEEISAEERASL